jgi:hypothetical protein
VVNLQFLIIVTQLRRILIITLIRSISLRVAREIIRKRIVI